VKPGSKSSSFERKAGIRLANSSSNAGAQTIAEILSEPRTWTQCLRELEATGQLRALSEKLPKDAEWVFVGCGSSYYLAQIAAATWSILTGGPSRAIPASDILLFPKLLPGGCQPVLISRSGQTSEVVDVARYFERELRIRTLAVTCGTGTPLETSSSEVIRLSMADDKSTVMTRSFTSMLLALQALAAECAGRHDLLAALRAVPTEMESRLAHVERVIRSLVNARSYSDYVFLGQGPFFGVAQESMLKVKEMSCSYAQAFHTLEFRHGPKAIVSGETLVTFFLSESGFDAETAVLEEVKGLGGATMVVTNAANGVVRRSADYLIELSLEAPEAARPAATVIAGQLLGFHLGIRRGFDPDQPRHLTRVVMLDNGNGGSPNRADT
jgi:glucosamine--fructose-6-phosphate aminotransferase (isomerizing)